MLPRLRGDAALGRRGPGWTVPRDEIALVGRDLQRPECVLAEPDGTLWSADARGGVLRIARHVLEATLPNGLAFDREGNFVIANFGTDAVERMTRAGESTTLHTEIAAAGRARRPADRPRSVRTRGPRRARRRAAARWRP